MKKIQITESDIKSMVDDVLSKTSDNDAMSMFEKNVDITDNEDVDERMESFYDAIESLASDGILCFKKIKQMISEDEYGVANAERLKPTLDKISEICDMLESFILDYGRV